MTSTAGVRHAQNEDYVLAEPLAGVFAVADGLGGHYGGAEASEVACECMLGALLETHLHSRFSQSDAEAAFAQGLNAATSEMREWSALEQAMATMGTTLTVGWFVGSRLFIAHVGDSRAYLYRDGKLRRLTVDHTYVQSLCATGQLLESERADSPLKHVLTRCINLASDTQLDVQSLRVKPNDQIILMSDGVTDWIEDHVLAIACQHASSPSELCDWLSQCALHAGSEDDRSCLVVRCGPARREKFSADGIWSRSASYLFTKLESLTTSLFAGDATNRSSQAEAELYAKESRTDLTN